MSGQSVGYIRVSSNVDQNTDSQLAEIELDRVFNDNVSTNTSTKNRPALRECLAYCHKGDTLHVHSMWHLARSLTDLQSIVTDLNTKGVVVCFYKEGLTFNGTADKMCGMVQMMGAFAEFEKSIINERQREGVAKALKNGVKFGPPYKLSADEVIEIKRMVAARYSKTAIAKQFNISRPTLYRALRS